LGYKQKTTIKADYIALNKSVSEFCEESIERDAAMPSPEGNTPAEAEQLAQSCMAGQRKNPGWN